jgi:hypothetical protein
MIILNVLSKETIQFFAVVLKTRFVLELADIFVSMSHSRMFLFQIWRCAHEKNGVKMEPVSTLPLVNTPAFAQQALQGNTASKVRY